MKLVAATGIKDTAGDQVINDTSIASHDTLKALRAKATNTVNGAAGGLTIDDISMAVASLILINTKT